jgi:hypothetical protein
VHVPWAVVCFKQLVFVYGLRPPTPTVNPETSGERQEAELHPRSGPSKGVLHGSHLPAGIQWHLCCGFPHLWQRCIIGLQWGCNKSSYRRPDPYLTSPCHLMQGVRGCRCLPPTPLPCGWLHLSTLRLTRVVHSCNRHHLLMSCLCCRALPAAAASHPAAGGTATGQGPEAQP